MPTSDGPTPTSVDELGRVIASAISAHASTANQLVDPHEEGDSSQDLELKSPDTATFTIPKGDLTLAIEVGNYTYGITLGNDDSTKGYVLNLTAQKTADPNATPASIFKLTYLSLEDWSVTVGMPAPLTPLTLGSLTISTLTATVTEGTVPTV